MNDFVEISGFEGRYAINRNGEVKNIKTNHILKPYTNRIGYFRIGFVIAPYKKKNFYIHRLLAKHFIPNPENKSEVNHIDGNPSNNNLNNLEWCTRSENGLHAHRTGLNVPNPAKGMNHPNAKLNDDLVREIRQRFKNGEKQVDIANSTMASKYQVNYIVLNKIWKHVK
jgi:hypothetical protein